MDVRKELAELLGFTKQADFTFDVPDTTKDETTFDSIDGYDVERREYGDNPMEEQQLSATSRLSQEEDVRLWREWKAAYDRESATGEYKETKKYFTELWKRFKPLIDSRINKYGGLSSNIPRQYFYGKAIVYFDKALKTYDPQKAKLNTWVANKMQELWREVFQYQDIGRIPASRLAAIGVFKAQYEILKSKLEAEGEYREPTIEELADATNLPRKTVENLMKEWRQELVSEGEGGEAAEEEFSLDEKDKIYEAINAIKLDMPEKYQLLIEHWFGLGGRKVLSNAQLAKKLGVTEAQVKKMKKYVENQLKEYLDAVGI